MHNAVVDVRFAQMLEARPMVGFFPALPVEKRLEFGDWMVGPLPDDVPWRSARFDELVKALLASVARNGFRNSALLWHRERGLDGQMPAPDVIEAIQAAVRFAVLDSNDRVLARDRENVGHYLATSENAELYVQPIDEKDGRIAYRSGGLLREQVSGGWRIGEGTLPLPDAVGPILGTVRVSRKLASAVFGAFSDTTNRDNRRLRVALEWHAAALANPRAVTLQQRLIALKTGFEALLGESGSRDCARRLRELFERVTAQHRDLLPCTSVLWSPSERADLLRAHQNRGGTTNTELRSEVEDWFMALADARNAIIHDGVVSAVEYPPPPERPLSRYQGPLFWTGERLLREGIKASLGVDVLLCVPIAARAIWTLIGEEMLRAATLRAHDVPNRAPTIPKPASAPRPLPVLLGDLGVPAANHVLFRKAVGGGSASAESARRMADAAVDKWVASAGARDLLVSSAEKDILERAGAEEELMDHLVPCE